MRIYPKIVRSACASLVMPDMVRIIIPDYFPPSPNKTYHAHWTKVRKLKQVAKKAVWVSCMQSFGTVPVFVGRVEVEITRLWGKGQRSWDYDNLWASCKCLIDAMRAEKEMRNQTGRVKQGGLGIFEDDNEASLVMRPGQYKNSSIYTDDPSRESCMIVIKGKLKRAK